jgi:glucose-1-phosphate cytidylyltransferase
MKTVLLAGGMGTRLAEETELRPKPMVEVGGRPILWHIMAHYAHHGFKEFLVALGYKGEAVKRYFLDYAALAGDLSVDLARGRVKGRRATCEDWAVHLIDTGLHTNTGGRLKRLERWLRGGTFLLTYGDGVADVDLRALVRFHRACGRVATVTAVRPPARFGRLEIEADQVVSFSEKPQMSEGWINGAFFVLEPSVLDLIEGDPTQFEREPLERLATEGQLMAYRHSGFWQCMDTLRDKVRLEGLWASDNAPWKVWS